MTARKTSSRPAPADLPEPDVDQAALRSLVGYNMKRAYLTVRADFVASLAHLALNPSQFSALALIVANPGVSQSALARALSVERSAVVALIDNLQNRAFVSRDPVPGDRRSYALRATLAGIRQWEKAIETIRVHEQRAFARLSDSERATLVELLSRVEG